MTETAPTRRTLFRLLAGLAASTSLSPASAQTPPEDRGIGGTRARPPEDEAPGGDRGIGGTGVIGTIRRFGSIVVNDLRIAYPADVAVRIDGASARVADLRIGHVVRVVAHGPEGRLTTRAIEVQSEVVGRVEAVAPGRMTVMGQRIATAGARAGGVRPGDRVAVSGLRRPDGVVVASLIERRPDANPRVAGPVRRGPDGLPAIGGLRLAGLDPGLVGARAVVEGRSDGDGLAVLAAHDASRPFAGEVARASIEAYVAAGPHGMRLGSGLAVAGAAGGIPRSGTARAVLTMGVAPDGRLVAGAVRVQGRDSTGVRGGGPDAGGRGSSARPGRAGDTLGRSGLDAGRPGDGSGRASREADPGRGGGGSGREPSGGYPLDTRSSPSDRGGGGGGLGNGGVPGFGRSGGGPGIGGGGFGGGGFGGGRGGPR